MPLLLRSKLLEFFALNFKFEINIIHKLHLNLQLLHLLVLQRRTMTRPPPRILFWKKVNESLKVTEKEFIQKLENIQKNYQYATFTKFDKSLINYKFSRKEKKEKEEITKNI